MVTERRSAAAILAAAPLRLHLVTPIDGVRFCSGCRRRTARQVFVYAVSEINQPGGHRVSEHKPTAVPELVAKFTSAAAKLRRGYIRSEDFPATGFRTAWQVSAWLAEKWDPCFGANAGDFRMRNLWTGRSPTHNALKGADLRCFCGGTACARMATGHGTGGTAQEVRSPQRTTAPHSHAERPPGV